MSAPTLACPKCQLSLRPAALLSPGQVIRCPKCATLFRYAGAAPIPQAPSDAIRPEPPPLPAPPPTRTPAPRPLPRRDSRAELEEVLPVREARPRSRHRDEDEPERKPRRRGVPLPGNQLVWIFGGIGFAAVMLFLVVLFAVGSFLWSSRPPMAVAPPGVPFIDDDGPPQLPGAPVVPVRRGTEDAVWIDGTQAVAPEAIGKERPWLVLDAGGHTAIVKRALFTPDNKQLITVSQDKTIRVWDIGTGEPLRVLRLPIGAGEDGALFAAALSRDGKRLAVGGRPPVNNGTGVPIYLLDLDKGRVERVLKGHTDIISALDFSPDGSRLASASADRSARICDVRTDESKHTLTGHTERLICVRFSPDGSRVATGSADKTARIYTTSDGRVERILRGHEQNVQGVGWTARGDSLVTASDDGFFRIFGRDGQPIKTINASQGEPETVRVTSLAIGSTGLALYGGVADLGKAGLYDLDTGKRRLSFDKHDNTVMDVALSADGSLAVSTGGNDHDVYIWKTTDGSVVRHIKGTGRSVWGIGWSPDGRSLAWGNNNRGEMERRPLERSLRLTDFELGPAPAGMYARARYTAGPYNLRQTDFFTIQVTANGKPVGTFMSPNKGERLYSMTIVPGDRAVIGGSYGMYLLNLRDGRLIRTFTGHSGLILSLAPSPDGRHFVSGSTDQTMCVWSPDSSQPLLSVFVADRDWIAWTPEGYYACSAYGERLMGWQINQGTEQLATFHPAARFRRSLYHPDVVREVLPSGGTNAALARLGKGGGMTLVNQVLPPEIKLLSPAQASLRQGHGKMEVEAEARSVAGHAVSSLRLLVNGRPYEGDRGIRAVQTPKPGTVRGKWKVDLPSGQHYLTVLAESSVSRGLSETAVVVNTSPPQLPVLHILAVGIADYPGDMKLNFAANDARSLTAAFEQHNNGTFREVKTRLLTDKQATCQNILTGLRWLESSMTSNDVAIVFFSGHGLRDQRGQFYLVPVDVNDNDPGRTCIPGEALKRALGNLPGRVIAMFDACHSGAAAEGRRFGRADDLARDLVTEDYGQYRSEPHMFM